MENWSTLHVFGFGDSQVIAPENSGKTKKSNDLTNLNAFVNHIWSLKPEGNAGQKEYHSINLFNGLFCDWHPLNREEDSFRIEFNLIDQKIIDDLIQEVLA